MKALYTKVINYLEHHHGNSYYLICLTYKILDMPPEESKKKCSLLDFQGTKTEIKDHGVSTGIANVGGSIGQNKENIGNNYGNVYKVAMFYVFIKISQFH